MAYLLNEGFDQQLLAIANLLVKLGIERSNDGRHLLGGCGQSPQLLEQVGLAQIEIHLLRDIIDVAKRVRIRESHLNGGFY